MGSATHRGDPIALLNLDPVLAQLHEDIKDPDFIKNLARDLLVNNQHRVTLVMTPDQDLANRKEAAEAAQLATIKAAMSDSEKLHVIEQAAALAERQQQKDDESILPKVGLGDVPEDIHIVNGESSNINQIPLSSYAQGTNGLVYQQILIELPELEPELLELLPYYSSKITELGIGQDDYLTTQSRQASVCGSISAFSTLRGSPDDEQSIKSYLVLSSKALVRNQKAQAELMQDTLLNVRFDETSRIKELLSQQRARREQSVTNNGHSLAMTAASSGMSPQAALSHNLSGLMGIRQLKDLDNANQDEAALKEYARKLQQLHSKILASKKQFLLIAEADKISECQQSLLDLWQEQSNNANSKLSLSKIRESRKQIWIANTQVNFCAKAYPTVTSNHPDAAALTVLGGFLRNGFLHRVIREQGGAYGGGASQDNNIAAFKFYSYRDPRLEETLADFDEAINWMLKTEHDPEQLEQAILGVVSSLDKPSSPAGEAKTAYHNNLFGRTASQRRGFRANVLKVTLDDLKRVTELYLKPEAASFALITHQGNYDEVNSFAKSSGAEIINL